MLFILVLFILCGAFGGSGAVEGMGYKVSIRGSAGLSGLRAGFKPWHLVLIVSPRVLSP